MTWRLALLSIRVEELVWGTSSCSAYWFHSQSKLENIRYHMGLIEHMSKGKGVTLLDTSRLNEIKMN